MEELSQGRAKRQKIDKHGRFAALEKLKNLKGSKNKAVIGDIHNVYDEVDEREYSKRVLERQEDDWIVDDGNGEYVEDGREIFDDEMGEESISAEISTKRKRGKLSKRGISQKGAGTIRNMLANMPAKKKTTVDSKVDDDALLDDIMGEIDNSSTKSSSNSTARLSSKEYLKSLHAKPSASQRETLPPPKKTPKRIDFSQKFSNDFDAKFENKGDIQKETFNITSNATKTSNFLGKLDEKPNSDEGELLNETNGDTSMNSTVEIIEFESTPACVDHQFDVSGLDDDIEDMDGYQTVDMKEDEKKTLGDVLEQWCDQDLNSIFAKNEDVHVQVDTSSLPVVTNEQGDKVFRFFWWDAYEDPFKQPGIVYLFGKVYVEKAQTYVSCCVQVKNVPRRVFLLPREYKMDLSTKTLKEERVTAIDVYKEFNEKVANTNKIMNFKSRKVVRKYAFDLAHVPAESEYLEVKYPSNHPKLPSDLQGETFCHVFGTNTTALELLLIERRIKGPCWLDIRSPRPATNGTSSAPLCSWCKIELTCEQMEDVSVVTTVANSTLPPPPPLTVLTVNIRTMANTKNLQNEVVMVSCLVQYKYALDKPQPQPAFQQHFCIVTRPSDTPWTLDIINNLKIYKGTQVYQQEGERSLLAFFLTKLFIIDPDLIVGHDFYGFTLDTLIHRIEHHKVPNWSRIGRLRRSVIPQIKGKSQDKNLLCGRLVCDINISAKELIRARSYDLDTLAKQILKVPDEKRQDFTPEEVKGMLSQLNGIITLINATMRDSSYILMLMYELNVIPLALQITNIAGNTMARTLLGGRSERNEFLLLHAFSEKEFIVPDKSFGKKAAIEDEPAEKASRKKPEYAGGLVLEPKKGFYDKFILLMDFNSLYPSIIQEYNICFTTVTRVENDDCEPEVPAQGTPMGILPIEIRKLVESRRQVKALMKAHDLNPDLKMQYNIRQTALKLTANSMYGCLGFSRSRFYAKPLAALVTSRGREILMNTRDVVQRMNFEVIYGDTDSIMINTNCLDYDQVFSIGNKIKQEVNKLYKHVELEVDGVFKYMLLLKKKKYAAVVLNKKPNGEIVATQEYKGLDIVRRDWSQLSAEVGRYVLDQILSDLNPDERISRIREHLEKVASDLRNEKVPIALLAITKQLAKNPDDYPDKKSLPHLQVAIRLNAREAGKKLRAGDTVSYVICEDETQNPPPQRAYHPDELLHQSDTKLRIDIQYYLAQQLHPVVARLCEPIEGADAAFIADCLGLDAAAYKKIVSVRRTDEQDEVDVDTLVHETEMFRHCDKFSFTCASENCKTIITMDGPFYDNYPVLGRCRNAACNTSPYEYLPCIQNSLQLAVRACVKKLYENWLICEDPACPNRTRRIPMQFVNAFPVCSLCKKAIMYREYRNSDLFYQLKYFKHIFTLKQGKVTIAPQVENAYRLLQEQIEEILNHNSYRILDFNKIFQFARREDKRKAHHLSQSQRLLLDSQKKWNAL